ncbi:MAG TPA: efflux RND transporter periplasmic adaptor subunit [Alphaproteobacteria bacterium]|nr:efflux RND transporter periplasmic adaptor subunit [Alphaproteobacteria bacterium]
MSKRMIVMLVAVAVVFGGIFGFISFGHYMRDKFMHAMGVPPQTVSTMRADTQDWQPKLIAVGSLRAVNGTNLSPQVAGTVSAIHFESGADVKAGTLLIELAQSDDLGKLRSLQATAALDRITLERDQKQLQVHAVSQQVVDTDEQNLKNAQGQVDQQQATLDYKNIRAPFDGRIGVRQVDLGQYLAPGTTIATLQSLDPIYVDFYLPQQALSQLKVGLPVTVSVDAYPDRSFDGEITAINPLVDSSTRNIQIRATLKNPDHLLLPGMYGKVEITTGQAQRYVTLPTTAVAFNSFGDTVFVVDDKGKDDKGNPKLVARQIVVTTGMTRGDQVAVLSGVKQGDIVVTAGQMKLRNGVPVVTNNKIEPKFDANQQPAFNQ